MSKFRVIGLWLGEHAPGWPDVRGFVDSTADPVEREHIAQRLDSGIPTDRAYMGHSTCRICGARNGSGELTDGVFIWPEGLAHYVRHHSVRLPDAVEAQLRDPTARDAETVSAAMAAENEDRDWDWWRQFSDAE